MKIFSIALCQNDCQPNKSLATEFELSSFGFFEKKSAQEFMTFFIRTVCERTKSGQRQSIEQDAYVGHVFANSEGLVGILITDKEYPLRVAFSVVHKTMDDLMTQCPKSQWKENMGFAPLQSYLQKYQDPHEADNIMKVQKELDETKVILHKTIQSVLDRGEQLDKLIERSDELSTQSKMFYKTAKKTNSGCCRMM